MAVRGRAALNEEQHANLLDLMPLVKEGKLTTVDLAARFRCSVPTILKYSRLPVGFTRARLGRPPRSTSDESLESDAA